jgi:hypothetical protein
MHAIVVTASEIMDRFTRESGDVYSMSLLMGKLSLLDSHQLLEHLVDHIHSHFWHLVCLPYLSLSALLLIDGQVKCRGRILSLCARRKLKPLLMGLDSGWISSSGTP